MILMKYYKKIENNKNMIDKDYKKNGIKVGSILGEHVIPNLIERGLM